MLRVVLRALSCRLPRLGQEVLELVERVGMDRALLAPQYGESHRAIERRHFGLGQRPRELRWQA
jgi:hypothetical protein